MLAWYREDPDDWEKTGSSARRSTARTREYQKASNGGIDCKINGAYVLMGLLYGKGDLDQTIVISCRGGQDSDCNPSSSAGVLFTTLGFSKLPDAVHRRSSTRSPSSATPPTTSPALLDVCEKLARQAIVSEGGRIEKDADGEEVFVIPVTPAKPSTLELSWAPGPIAKSRFTEAEMAQITASGSADAVKKAVEKFAPGWTHLPLRHRHGPRPPRRGARPQERPRHPPARPGHRLRPEPQGRHPRRQEERRSS